MKNPSVAGWGKKSDFLAVLFLSGLIIFFYHQILFGNTLFAFVDASRFFYPLWKWGAAVLRQGIIPLWNPDAQFGTPYFADPQMACAYLPVPILYSCLNPPNAFAALIVVHHLWALLGFWFFARLQGFTAKTALLGSFVFGFSLHVVCSSWTPVALMTISWVPWVFLAVEKIFQGRKGGWLTLSFAWAMQLSAGYPALVYLTVLAVSLELLWKSLRQSKDRWRWMGNRAGPIATAGITALAYNLVWGLPFAELFLRSNYQNGASRFHELGWLDLATALNPFLPGIPAGNSLHGPYYWVSTYFLGLPTLCLLAWGAYRRVYQRASWGIFLALLALSSGVLNVDKLLRIILPGYTLVVHSGYWISFLAFWAAWLAMESADSFIIEKKKSPWVWMGLAGFVYGVSLFFQMPPPAAFWLSLLLLGTAAWLGSPLGRWGLIAASLGLSLGTAAVSLNRSLDRSYYEDPPKILSQLTREGRLFFPPPLMREAGLLQDENMAKAYEIAKQNLYPDWPLTFGKEEVPIYNTLRLNNSFAWTYQAFRYSLKHSRAALDYLNIRYLFGKNKFKDFKPLAGAGDLIKVSENPTVFPKWFSVEKAMAAGPTAEDDFLKADKVSMDYGKQCFIADPGKAGIYHPREVMMQIRTPNRLVLAAPGKGRALLVSSETAFAGWKALVEGKARTVEQINHAFRGVVLEEGETGVVFNYDPTSFRLGLFCSLLVWGLWTGLLIRKAFP